MKNMANHRTLLFFFFYRMLYHGMSFAAGIKKPLYRLFCKEVFGLVSFQESVNDHVLGLCLGEPE